MVKLSTFGALRAAAVFILWRIIQMIRAIHGFFWEMIICALISTTSDPVNCAGSCSRGC